MERIKISTQVPLILASASPRRREILQTLGVPFTVCPATEEEAPSLTVPPEQAVLRVAESKARAVAKHYPDRVVLASDTMVLAPAETGEAMLGKPHSREQAADMLRLLSGRTHRVLTAVYVHTPEGGGGFTDTAEVAFFPMTEEEIADYVASGEPMDKAGAYGAQGRGGRYVQGVKGDFYTVMGLPSGRLWRFLAEFCVLEEKTDHPSTEKL